MKSVSLFSGIGGFDLGFQRAGIECVAVCEIDKNAQSVLLRRFPEAKLFDDVRKVGKKTHERKSIDIVCGGFPCQDVSIGHQPLIAQTLTGGSGKRGYVDPVNTTLVAWEMQHASEAYRETQGGIAPTLQSRMGTGGNQVPMVGLRRLMPIECERLQGFPDGWTDGQSDSTRYKQLGNAVAVPVVEWIGKRIVSATMS